MLPEPAVLPRNCHFRRVSSTWWPRRVPLLPGCALCGTDSHRSAHSTAEGKPGLALYPAAGFLVKGTALIFASCSQVGRRFVQGACAPTLRPIDEKAPLAKPRPTVPGASAYLHNSIPALIGSCQSGQASRASRLSSVGSVMPSAESSAIFWLRAVIRSQSYFKSLLGSLV